MPIISSESITKIFSPKSKTKSVTALAEMSLAVNEGEIFGLLGPNGAGKTTFIKVLLEIVFPTSGSASILGRSVGDTEAKTRVGYLPENHKYPAYLTGEQVLRFFGRLSGMDSAAIDASITENSRWWAWSSGGR
ncbi:MAG: ATP-binding cassette domain-containing protein [Ignavibacteria bacterium]|nr:ATP-binding cassette domain-containing protein [Ignavibacteria bacterium]